MERDQQTITAPVITFSRLRMQSDGQGVTTLVCFHGCPLRCKWCINPFSFSADTKYESMTPEMLYEKVKIDELYFLATGGGITFGGGEPLLYARFIKCFRQICGEDWHLCAETSLSVPWENVQTAAECIDMFYIDCKDTNPDIYRRYTGKSNGLMIDNLKKLLKFVGSERIVVRLPLIPGFNTEEDRQKSQEFLAGIGVRQFDLFTYKTDIKK
ncbi:MAG: radical SAM protein [Clostridia bacterium]|nr:radical SAM protein [Clostridia bacterium]